MVTRKNGRAPGRRWEREKGAERKKKEGYEVDEGRRFLTYATSGAAVSMPAGALGRRRDTSGGSEGRFGHSASRSGRVVARDNVAAMISLVVLRGPRRAETRPSLASRATIRARLVPVARRAPYLRCDLAAAARRGTARQNAGGEKRGREWAREWQGEKRAHPRRSH